MKADATPIAADDPRHGTNAGYIAHALSGAKDYCDPCRNAHRKNRNRNRLRQLRGQPAKVPCLGSVRRVQALLALGHTHAEISAAADAAPTMSANVLVARYPVIKVEVAAAVARAYEQLSMTVPQGWKAEQCRRRAVKAGYLPPLAWNDIDDPAERPARARERWSDSELDEVVVLRAMDGHFDRHFTTAERREVTRRWIADGRSVGSLERASGWRVGRYMGSEADAA